MSCLSQTLTSSSNITLVTCVNPAPCAVDHSIPAVKFIARIRDCIVRKKAQKQSLNSSKQAETQKSSSRASTYT